MGEPRYPIYLLTFPSQYLLAATFLRFQEHYESPKFRGRVFTWEEFMDWYAATRGEFSYLKDWGGFNIPDRVLRPFYAGAFDPLTAKERKLLETLRGVEPPYYVIGTVNGGLAAMVHELVHGLFTTMPDYRHDVRACLSRHDLAAARKILLKMGYCREVLDDELNAYLTTGLDGKLKTQQHRVKPVRQELLAIFNCHFGLSIGDRRNWRRLLDRTHRIKFRP